MITPQRDDERGRKLCHQYFVHPYAKQFCMKQKGDLEAFPTFHLSRCRSEQKLHSAVHADNFVAAPLGALSVRSFSWPEAFHSSVDAELNLYINVQEQH